MLFARLAEVGEWSLDIRDSNRCGSWVNRVGEYLRLLFSGLMVGCRELPLLDPVEPVERGLGEEN